ncbi:MAG TPA: hypothetical protein VFK38_07465 [Candidatus Limnocylindrales bacterium]|nr:hypothetical protein [Candidatus Limnocylindrales bacterium]
MATVEWLRSGRGAIVVAALVSAWWLVGLRLDADGDLARQVVLGALTWVILGLALAASRPDQRLQVLVMVGVATGFECLGSLVWGLYQYRLENLPLYVPPGHGLFYLVALRIADLPAVTSRRRLLVPGVLLGGAVLALAGLIRGGPPDLLGALTWLILARFLLRGRAPVFYAVSFVLTMLLEAYGTALGTWAWQPVVPLLGIAAGNPPACIGAGYCVMDGLARRLTARLRRATGRPLPEAAPQRIPVS